MNYALYLFLIGSFLISIPIAYESINEWKGRTHIPFNPIAGFAMLCFYIGVFLYFLSFLFVVRNF